MGAQEGAALPFFFGKLLLLLLLASGRVDALATLHDTGHFLVFFLIKLSYADISLYFRCNVNFLFISFKQSAM